MDDIHVGKIIRNCIIESHCTQTKVANDIAISKQGLTTLLNKPSVGSDRIIQISNSLKVNIYQILANEVKRKNLIEYPEPVNVQDNEESIQVIFTVPLRKKKELLKLLNS